MKSDAMDKMYSKYYKDVYLYALSLCREEELAKDLVSETFFKALMASNQAKGPVKYWLFRILKNHYIDLIRKNQEYLTFDSHQPFLTDLSINDPEKDYIRKERNQRLFKHLIQLEPVIYREVIYTPGFEKIQNPFPDNAEDNALELREEIIQQNNETTIQYLENLDEFSYVSMNISFTEDLTMEEFHRLRITYPNLDFKWIGVRTVEPETLWTEEQPMFLIGFNPNFNDEPGTNNRPNSDQYPYFDLVDVLEESSTLVSEFPQAYATHFISRLSYLSDQEEFVGTFDANPNKLEFYNNSLNYVNEKGVETYGGLVYGSAGDFLEALNEIPYDTLHINDVTPTSPDIYND